MPAPSRSPARPLRVFLLLLAVRTIGAPGPLSAQEGRRPPAPVRVGERVQIEWVDREGVSHRTRGRLMGTSGAELAVEGGNREVTVVPFDRVESLRRRTGVHPALGAMLGTALGLGAGAALTPESSRQQIFDGRAAMIAVGGAFVGAFVGYGIFDARAWTDAPLPGPEPSQGAAPLLGLDRLDAASGVSIRLGIRWAVGR